MTDSTQVADVEEVIEQPKQGVQIINIDGTEYSANDLSQEQRFIIGQLQVIETKIAELSSEIEVFNTAKQSYVKKLKVLLEMDK